MEYGLVASFSINPNCVPIIVSARGRNAGAESIAISAQVPGDIITDFERNKLTGDPLFEFNFKNSR